MSWHRGPDEWGWHKQIFPGAQVAEFSHGGSQSGTSQSRPVELWGHSQRPGPTHVPPFWQPAPHVSKTIVIWLFSNEEIKYQLQKK